MHVFLKLSPRHVRREGEREKDSQGAFQEKTAAGLTQADGATRARPPGRGPLRQSWEITSAGRTGAGGEAGAPRSAAGGATRRSRAGRQPGSSSASGPAIPLLRLYPRNSDTYTPVFVAALLTLSETAEATECPATEEWVNETWSSARWNTTQP